MSPKTISEILSAIQSDVKNAYDTWVVVNQDTLKTLPKEAVQAAAAYAFITALPADVVDPDLNTKKMEAAATLFEFSADQNDAIQKAMASAKEIFGDLIKNALGMVAKIGLSALIAAV